MAFVIYDDGKYSIKKFKGSYILCNNLGTYENHGHFKKYDTCLLVIKLMEKNIVPDSSYLRESVLRISTDENYLEKVRVKLDKGTKKYININKGVKRK